MADRAGAAVGALLLLAMLTGISAWSAFGADSFGGVLMRLAGFLFGFSVDG